MLKLFEATIVIFCKMKFQTTQKAKQWKFETKDFQTKTKILKPHGNEAHFMAFLQIFVSDTSAQYISRHSDFCFEFAEIFVIDKRLTDSPNRRKAETQTLRAGKSYFDNEHLREIVSKIWTWRNDCRTALC